MGIGPGTGPGGAREGAGRPPGQLTENVKSSKLAMKIAMDGGETPFGIMLKAARAMWKKACPDGENVEDMELAKDAADVAAKAAPYVHPKLANIQLEGSSDQPFVISFDREDRDA